MGIQGRPFLLHQAQAECFTRPLLLRRDTFQPFPGPLATGGINSAPIWVARLSEDWFLRPNIINHGTIAYNRNNNNFVPLDPTPGCPARVGLKGVNQESVCPQLNILNYPSFGPGGISIVPENGWNFVDNVSWITGKHNYKFGFDIRYNGDNTYSTNRDAGYFNFSNLETGPTWKSQHRKRVCKLSPRCCQFG